MTRSMKLPTEEKSGNFPVKREINYKPMSTVQFTFQLIPPPKITDLNFSYRPEILVEAG